MSTSNQKYILQKFESHYAIWFRVSKSFVLFAEPAFEVFRLYVGKTGANAIKDHCIQKYGHIEGNISQFVTEIIQYIRYYSDRSNAVNISQKKQFKPDASVSSFLPPVYYCLGDKRVQVKYASQQLKFAFHPGFAHLETPETKNTEHCIECISGNNLVGYRYNGKVVDAFASENMEYYTGGFKQLLYSILYNKSYYSWMMALHASGVVQNGQALLFSAAGGSGKSTISAMLKAHGYGYLSDDLISADKNGEVYPFPAAISVKEGSAERLSAYYPELKEMNQVLAFTGKQVRYLPVHNQTEISEAPYPVKALVFINFKKSGSFIFEEVEKREALQLLLKETWVNPNAENVSRFFGWVERTPFFRLQYSETSDALEATRKLFATPVF